MDPYLESWIWGDFHSNLIAALRAAAERNRAAPLRRPIRTGMYGCDDPETEFAIARPAGFVRSGPRVLTCGRNRRRRWPPPAPACSCRIRHRERQRVSCASWTTRSGESSRWLKSSARPTKPPHETGERIVSSARSTSLAASTWWKSTCCDRDRPAPGRPASAVADYYILVSRSRDVPAVGDSGRISVRDPLPPSPGPTRLRRDRSQSSCRLARLRATALYDEGALRRAARLTRNRRPRRSREPDAAWARDTARVPPNPPPTA